MAMSLLPAPVAGVDVVLGHDDIVRMAVEDIAMHGAEGCGASQLNKLLRERAQALAHIPAYATLVTRPGIIVYDDICIQLASLPFISFHRRKKIGTASFSQKKPC